MCFIYYFHRHLLSFYVDPVFESPPQEIWRTINSTIIVKTWEVHPSFPQWSESITDEISDKLYYRNLNIELTSYLTANSDLRRRVRPVVEVYVWTIFPLSLFGIRRLKYFIPLQIKLRKSEILQSDLTNIDHVSSNMKSSNFSTILYVFEDNEVVIKMIVKSRSPTMTHVSRFHRVAMNWFFW